MGQGSPCLEGGRAELSQEHPAQPLNHPQDVPQAFPAISYCIPSHLGQAASWRAAPQVPDLRTWPQKSRGCGRPQPVLPQIPCCSLSSVSGFSSDTCEAEAIRQGGCHEMALSSPSRESTCQG